MSNQSKYLIISLFSIGALISGCKKDFLIQEPESSLLGANFWKTESDLQQGVVGSYASLRDMSGFSYWLFGEMRSDNTTFQYNAPQRGQENREFVDQFLVTSDNTLIRDYWRDCYIGIARCNDVLDNVERIQMSDNSRNQAIGEVRFLRAFHYFNLVRQFGAVPLRLEVTKSPGDANSKGRAGVDEIYKQIIADLNESVSKLPSVSDYAAADKGRVTSGSANALLGEVFLTQKKYGEALTALKKVTGYMLLADYANLFTPANKNNAESIFEIQYLGSVPNLSSNFMYQFAPFNSGSSVTLDPATNLSFNSGWNTPSADLISSYESSDVRKDISISEGFTSDGSFINSPYIRKYNHGFIQPGQTDVNFPVIRYADVLLMIAECMNEQGFSANGEAFDLLNQIRTRAHLPAKTSGNADPSLNITNQQAFRDAIFQERKVELAFENHRWYDLVRSGTAVDVMNAHGQREMAIHSYIPSGSYAVTTNNLLLPIPQREVTIDNLPQNP
jgi:hypothetical protein